jgi:hypothetical protein
MYKKLKNHKSRRANRYPIKVCNPGTNRPKRFRFMFMLQLRRLMNEFRMDVYINKRKARIAQRIAAATPEQRSLRLRLRAMGRRWDS